MNRQKILFLFDHPLALRSYIETGLIDELNQIYEISLIFLGSEDGNSSKEIWNLKINAVESFILSIYSNIYWIKIANKSLSIQNRVWYSKLKFKKFLSARRLATLYNTFFSAMPIKLFSFLLFGLFKILDLNVKKSKPSKIIYITVGGTLTISDFLYTRYHKDIEVITVLENWDNMSSKAVFAFPPKKIGVWGNQSVNFAENIHGIERRYVKPIGNPRINWLLDNVGNDERKTSIFFGGGSVNFDAEIDFLIATIEIAKIYGLKIDYLPHPKNYKIIQQIKNQQNLSKINFLGGVNLLDSTNQIILPKLIDYVKPYRSAKIFVSPLSTMNLEAAILNIPSVAIDLSTKLGVLPNKISDRHEHIHEAKHKGIFHFVSTTDDYKKLLENLLGSYVQNDPEKNLNYFVRADQAFIENLLELINS